MGRIGKQDLIEELQSLADDLGQPPSTNDMRERGKHSPTTYKRRFESWNNAIEEAGLNPDEGRQAGSLPQLSEEDLIDELERLANEMGKPPTREEMRTRGKHSADPYQRVFGTWGDALEAAGLQKYKSSNVSKEELLKELERLSGELGDTPTQSQMNEHGEYSHTVFQGHFGSWNNAVREAGLEPNTVGGRSKRISDGELIEEIHRLFDAYGRVPSSSDMDEEGEYSANTYYLRFGSWSDAIEAAGLGEYRYTPRSANADYLREHGPSIMEELPRTSMNTNDKINGMASFSLQSRSVSPEGSGGVTTSVYYLIDEHDKENVIRKFLFENPKFIENKSRHGVMQTIRTAGKDWSAAAKDAVDQFYDGDDVYTTAQFLFAVSENEPASTTEVVNEVECTQAHGLQQLKELAEDGDLKKKKEGTGYVWTIPE